MADISKILEAIELGDANAADELLPLVYKELRTLAERKMAVEPAGLTLQPTALVHEAYLRLTKNNDQEWKSRSHFFAAAAEAMRRILIEDARRKNRLKHGGKFNRIDLDPAEISEVESSEDLLALNDALAKLSDEDSVKAELVKLRYFAGLTLEQASEILGISRTTAARYWTYSRAWLFQEIKRGESLSQT